MTYYATSLYVVSANKTISINEKQNEIDSKLEEDNSMHLKILSLDPITSISVEIHIDSRIILVILFILLPIL